MGDAELTPGLPRGAARVPARPRRRPRRRLPGTRRAEPAADPRLQARRLAGRDRAGAPAHRAPERRSGGRTSRASSSVSPTLGIEYELAPRLVRGFDYYTSTTFEFVSDALDAAQNAVGGGGRYDQLAEEMGGPPTPGIGFGIGIERVLHRVRRRRSCSPATTATASTCSWSTVWATGRRRAARRRAARIGPAGRPRLRRPLREGSVEAGGPGRRASFGVMLGSRRGARATRWRSRISDRGEQVEVHRGQLVGWLRARLEERRRT